MSLHPRRIIIFPPGKSTDIRSKIRVHCFAAFFFAVGRPTVSDGTGDVLTVFFRETRLGSIPSEQNSGEKFLMSFDFMLKVQVLIQPGHARTQRDLIPVVKYF